MITSHGITNAAGFYESNMQAQKTGGIAEKNIIKAEETTVKSSEDKLSAKAQKYLESLRETYGDYDFIIADDGDDRQALLKQSNKEFSVIFSSAELERMASDEKYAQEKLHAVKTIVEMTDRINQQFGYERAWGKNGTGIINKIAVSINDDGSVSILAELEKTLEKQKDYVAQIKEKHAEEKMNAEELAEKRAKEKEAEVKKESEVKKMIVQASSEEELIEKIRNVDWSKATGEELGIRFDFSI